MRGPERPELEAAVRSTPTLSFALSWRKFSGIGRTSAQRCRQPSGKQGDMLADLLEVGSRNLSLDLFQNLVRSLRASPCQRTDDLASGFLGERELPGAGVLQLDDLLSERELPGSAGGQIDSSNGNLGRHVHVKKLAEQHYLIQVGKGRGARYTIK